MTLNVGDIRIVFVELSHYLQAILRWKCHNAKMGLREMHGDGHVPRGYGRQM